MLQNFDRNKFELIKNYKGDLFVGVDVGGTNTRISICGQDIFTPLFEYKFLCSSKDTLLKTFYQMEELLKGNCSNNKDNFVIRSSVMAIAGPISRFETFATITNYKGERESDRELEVCELPTVLFPHNKTRFINDLKGTCLGIISLHHANRVQEHFGYGWRDNGEKSIQLDNRNSYTVMAVGTGLGTAAILSLSPTQFEVVPLEGGHITMFHCSTHSEEYQKEKQLFEYIQDKVWEGNHQPEFEDILSGRGMESLYKYYSRDIKDAPSLNAGQVSETAISNPQNHNEEIRQACRECLTTYYKFYARASKNLSILLQTKGGLFWAGDNLMSNSSFIRDNIDVIHKEFLDSPKRNWIEHIPLFLQTKSCNFNLYGALHYATKI